MNAALRLQALVRVVVPGEHDADTVFQEQRLEEEPDVDGGPCRPALLYRG